MFGIIEHCVVPENIYTPQDPHPLLEILIKLEDKEYKCHNSLQMHLIEGIGDYPVDNNFHPWNEPSVACIAVAMCAAAGTSATQANLVHNWWVHQY